MLSELLESSSLNEAAAVSWKPQHLGKKKVALYLCFYFIGTLQYLDQ